MVISYKDDKWSTIGILDMPEGEDRGDSLVVTLHAGGSNKAGLRGTFVKLSRLAVREGLSVFRFDLPLHGESIVFGSSIVRVDAIHDLLLYMKKTYRFKKIILLGHCVGGYHALDLCLKYPAIVDEVVLWHIAPIIYGMAEDERVPGLRFMPRLKRIYSSLKEVRYRPAAGWKAIKQGADLLGAVLTHPVKIGAHLVKSRANKKNAAAGKKNLSGRKVCVVINPSKMHYKEMHEGMTFIRQALLDFGFKEVQFAESNHKVFSVEWQKTALSETIRYIKNLNKIPVDQ
jgi:pimeloyl-ACP methyl ester carboxylesterase